MYIYSSAHFDTYVCKFYLAAFKREEVLGGGSIPSLSPTIDLVHYLTFCRVSSGKRIGGGEPSITTVRFGLGVFSNTYILFRPSLSVVTF